MIGDSTGNEHIDGVIDELEGRIADMHTMIDQLRALAATLGNSASKATSGRGGSVTSFGHDAFFGMTVAEAAKKYLTGIKKTATVGTLSDALIAGGLKSTAKNMPENVRAIISRNTDFVRINGEFGLAEWYPGRKAGAKSKKSEGQENTVTVFSDGTRVIEGDNEVTPEEAFGVHPSEQPQPSSR